MIGCQILKRQRAVSLELARQFLQVPVANVSDCMSRMTAGGARLRPMHDGTAMAGPAFTIKTRPGDNLLIHKALKLAQPGDVIVVDAGGDLTNALIGEIMVGEAKLKGFGGIVINGAIRDSAVIRKDGFPVFAAGVTHRGPYKDGPGEINVPVCIGGMTVMPGDIIIGDEDGVLAFPPEEAEALIAKAQAQKTKEEATIQAILEDRWDLSFVDALEARCNN